MLLGEFQLRPPLVALEIPGMIPSAAAVLGGGARAGDRLDPTPTDAAGRYHALCGLFSKPVSLLADTDRDLRAVHSRVGAVDLSPRQILRSNQIRSA